MWQEQQIDIDKAVFDPASIFKAPEEALGLPHCLRYRRSKFYGIGSTLELSNAIEEGMETTTFFGED